jgi:hypothetical protein
VALRALGLAEAEISEILQRRRDNPFTSPDRWGGRGLAATSATFRIEAEGALDGQVRARLTAVVQKRTQGLTAALTILEWSDSR